MFLTICSILLTIGILMIIFGNLYKNDNIWGIGFFTTASIIIFGFIFCGLLIPFNTKIEEIEIKDIVKNENAVVYIYDYKNEGIIFTTVSYIVKEPENFKLIRKVDINSYGFRVCKNPKYILVKKEE